MPILRVGAIDDIVTLAYRRASRGLAYDPVSVDERSIPRDTQHPQSLPYSLWVVGYSSDLFDAVYHAARYGLRQHWRTGGVAAPQWRGSTLMFYDTSFDFPNRYVRTNPFPSSGYAQAPLRKWVAMDEFLRYDQRIPHAILVDVRTMREYVDWMHQETGVEPDTAFRYDEDLVFDWGGTHNLYATWDQDAPPSAVVYTARNGVKILLSQTDPGTAAMRGMGDEEDDEPAESALERLLGDQATRDDVRQSIEDEFLTANESSEGYSDEWWQFEINRRIEEAYLDGEFGSDEEILE